MYLRQGLTALLLTFALFVTSCVEAPCEISEAPLPTPEATTGPYANSAEMNLAEIRFVCSDRSLRPIWNDLLREPQLMELLFQSKLQSEYDCTEILRVREIDLNDDSKPEFIVSFQYIGVCSPTANCPMAIYGIFDDERSKVRTSAGIYDFSLRRLLFDLGSISLKEQNSESNGYRDMLAVNNGGNNDDFQRQYSFDGEEYRLKKCWQFEKARQKRYREACPADDEN